ncbi:DUF1211 domain-containing protein [Microbacterium protaetiae]|uniref:DUF1211 domain-containing protein n=1 Tax=Microbacterium protaetiae TaxID=2509458 RepID=A0A4P6EAK4_9MICO|nr:TMEM175 family protein [Microbacterium protaetiae]QAY59160.1 DUF1211 domain-containing protein [Microbacterium protaetiae]
MPRPVAPQYLAYVLSFATTGAVWFAHNALSENLAKTDSALMRLNLLLLLFVAFTPFPTRFLAEYITVESSERVAVTIYGLSFLVLTGMVIALWRYAKRAQLVADPDDGETTAYSQRLPIGVLAYVLLIVIGLFAPMVAVFGYLALAVFFMVPMRIGRRESR